jgi:hypothetical protein
MTSSDMLLTLGVHANGDPFTLPRDAATQKFAFLARSGAGKTYAASRLAEEMHAAGMQFVVLDPVGVWYGLRLAADGIGTGLAIPVFGGEFGDIPLEPTSGALVADVVVDRHLSVVLDVSGFRKGQRKQFVTDFAEHLFQRKKTARSPLHLFLEEAQAFVPQRTMSGDERMLGAFEDIGKIGRNYGIGLTLISQRPQAVHKDVLNQAEALFVLQLNAAQERKAVRDWIDAQGLDVGAAVAELPQLPIGEALVWSPQWLKHFGKVRILPKRTYNASATPTFETAAVTPHPLDADDLAALRESMQAAVQQAEASDPVALRRRIADLERQLAAQPPTAAPEAARMQIQRLEAAVSRLEVAVAQLQSPRPAVQQVEQEIAPSQVSTPSHAKKPVRRSNNLSAPQQRILDALAAFAGLGLRDVAKQHVAVWSKQSPRSSAYTNHLGALRTAGLIDYPRAGYVALTPAGQARARASEPILSIVQLHAAWYARLPAPQASILRTVITAHPRSLTRKTLAQQSGASASSSAYTNNLGALRSLGLIDYPKPGYVVATALLFPKRMSER